VSRVKRKPPGPRSPNAKTSRSYGFPYSVTLFLGVGIGNDVYNEYDSKVFRRRLPETEITIIIVPERGRT
jgi:hypothetical protein